VYTLNEFAGQSAIVFASTCATAQRTALMLKHLGFSATSLHGQMSQSKRLGSLAKFKSGSRTVLVATDVAARGLDIPSVRCPCAQRLRFCIAHTQPPCYRLTSFSTLMCHPMAKTTSTGLAGLHVVRMSALALNEVALFMLASLPPAAGRAGRAITFVTQYDIELYQRIEHLLGRKLDVYPANEEAAMLLAHRVAEAQRMAAMDLRDADDGGGEAAGAGGGRHRRRGRDGAERGGWWCRRRCRSSCRRCGQWPRAFSSYGKGCDRIKRGSSIAGSTSRAVNASVHIRTFLVVPCRAVNASAAVARQGRGQAESTGSQRLPVPVGRGNSNFAASGPGNLKSSSRTPGRACHWQPLALRLPLALPLAVALPVADDSESNRWHCQCQWRTHRSVTTLRLPGGPVIVLVAVLPQ